MPDFFIEMSVRGDLSGFFGALPFGAIVRSMTHNFYEFSSVSAKMCKNAFTITGCARVRLFDV